jgi:hypothetical protein
MAGSTILGPIGPDATSNCLKGLAQATGSNFCGATQSEIWDRYAEKLAGLQFFASRYLGRPGKMVIPCHQSVSPAAVHKSPAGGAGSYGFLPPIHCKSVPGVISSNPCLWL